MVSVLPYLFFGWCWRLVDRVNGRRLMVLTDLARALVIAYPARFCCGASLGLVDLRRSVSHFRPHDLL